MASAPDTRPSPCHVSWCFESQNNGLSLLVSFCLLNAVRTSRVSQSMLLTDGESRAVATSCCNEDVPITYLSHRVARRILTKTGILSNYLRRSLTLYSVVGPTSRGRNALLGWCHYAVSARLTISFAPIGHLHERSAEMRLRHSLDVKSSTPHLGLWSADAVHVPLRCLANIVCGIQPSTPSSPCEAWGLEISAPSLIERCGVV